jgi:hypothetical protein
MAEVHGRTEVYNWIDNITGKKKWTEKEISSEAVGQKNMKITITRYLKRRKKWLR